MTAVAGFVHGNFVYIGADTQGTAGTEFKQDRADTKTFKRGPFLFGTAGSYRAAQVMKYQLEVDEQRPDQSNHHYMCTTFVDAVQKVLKTNNIKRLVDGIAEHLGTFLVGYRGSLYCVEQDYQVAIANRSYDAAGSGREYVLGSLHTLMQLKTDLMPIDLLTIALNAATAFSPTVGSRFTFVTDDPLFT